MFEEYSEKIRKMVKEMITTFLNNDNVKVNITF